MKTIILLTLISSTLFVNPSSYLMEVKKYSSVEFGVTKSDKAYQVLTNKCNVCHKTQNPRKVFTRENMNALAPKIYKQVFVRKRMPRGNKIKLTNVEYAILENWLLTLNLK
ncbi:MAG: hypothetical protein JKX68_09880 [Flavobacteriales bacterium]|nr:hypothetical protein [Flavobacteriales bacterium]